MRAAAFAGSGGGFVFRGRSNRKTMLFPHLHGIRYTRPVTGWYDVEKRF
jgi:hypothetical protein